MRLFAFSDENGHVTALAYDPRVELHREEIDMAHVERPERTSMVNASFFSSSTHMKSIDVEFRIETRRPYERIVN